MRQPFSCCTDCHHRRGCSSRSSRVFRTATIWSRRIIPASATATGPIPKTFAYTFDHYAEIMNHFTEALGLSRYTLYMQDYGGPVGFRMALAHPDRIEALIVQDAVAHNEGPRRELEYAARVLGRSRCQRERAADESALARHDADASRRQRSERRAVRSGSLDGRVRLSQPAGPGRHSERSVLRLSHERRRLSHGGRRGCARRSRGCS